MCKDYMSLEMTSFISRLRVFASKNCFITPSLWQMGPGEAQQSTQKKRRGGWPKSLTNMWRYLFVYIRTCPVNGFFSTGGKAASTQLWVEPGLGCHACWREPAVPLDGVRSYRRALGPWQEQDNKSRRTWSPLHVLRPREGRMHSFLPTAQSASGLTLKYARSRLYS